VKDDVEGAPAAFDGVEGGVDLGVVRHVERHHEGRAYRVCEFFDARLELVALIGETELGAFTVHRFGDAGGDGSLAGDSGDQCFFSGEKTHVSFLGKGEGSDDRSCRGACVLRTAGCS
jgi:hypothetical protein